MLAGCKKDNKPFDIHPAVVGTVVNEMTDVMVHDVTNPPLGARFFAYACLAGYEVIAQNDSAYRSMFGVLNNYPSIKRPEGIENHAYQLTAALAMLETARKMQPSGALLRKYQDRLIDSCRKAGLDADRIAGSQAYALAISKEILKYAKSDRYNRISNFPRYEPSRLPGTWYPTPPGYFPPVEPYFRTVRPFTLDTCSQFRGNPPVAFSEDKNSAFFKLMKLNYDDTKQAEHLVMAAYWDCNPFALENRGHLLVGMKKISPGAHWMGITNIACGQAKADFAKTTLVNTSVAVGLMDSFMACWDEKYLSNRIRPETAIRKYIDPSWKPFLQTPPFPEYLSGHSVISTTSAIILTHYFGDKFAYTDTVEERFGLKARKFASFAAAAQESAMSRFYGGIHFMDAVTNGQVQGARVGEWVVKKLGVKQQHSGR
ncbi:vanadium-dependent haloperoxidase [Dyadobacter sandarakinus]|uniref:Vanadium-dependent haloperoxidase n=2 Tax=Dyadobacter sandarakinus TaxID=2747268 RepID=A0ABX7IDW3_9BACT|nr:vanadium-dependent haloperoxidase [Dyadobacter sandarakinus]